MKLRERSGLGTLTTDKFTYGLRWNRLPKLDRGKNKSTINYKEMIQNIAPKKNPIHAFQMATTQEIKLFGC